MKRLVNPRIFLFCAVGLVLGILCGHAIMFGNWLPFGILVGVFALTFVVLLLRKNNLRQIVLFTLILASVSVGLSTWNVHYQAEIGTIGYEKLDPVTQESLLNRYVYFEPVKDADGNITNPTKQDYPISGSLN